MADEERDRCPELEVAPRLGLSGGAERQLGHDHVPVRERRALAGAGLVARLERVDAVEPEAVRLRVDRGRPRLVPQQGDRPDGAVQGRLVDGERVAG